MKRLCLIIITAMLTIAADVPAPTSYFNDFSKAEVGKVPDDLMVLDGTFAVRDVEGDKCLELEGTPIGTFGVLFGPAALTTCEVSARIWAQPTGKRFPEFGIGANDAGGYKVFVLPGRSLIELRKGDDAVASARFAWKASSWTDFKLRVSGSGSSWSIKGKVWKHGDREPADWMVTAKDTTAPTPGRASIWANDYSEKPVRFDDIKVSVP